MYGCHLPVSYTHLLTIADWLTQYSESKDATYVRGFLGRMLFPGEDGVKKVRILSGGEKVRCLLSKMMISGANVPVSYTHLYLHPYPSEEQTPARHQAAPAPPQEALQP